MGISTRAAARQQASRLALQGIRKCVLGNTRPVEIPGTTKLPAGSAPAGSFGKPQQVVQGLPQRE